MTEPSLEESAEVRPSRRFRMSGKGVAVRLVLAMALTAILIPAALKLPTWIEYEIVLAVWWMIWLGALTSLLYTGMRVTDDHQLSEPRSWIPSSGPSDSRKKKSTSDGGWGWGWPGPVIDAEGCLYVIGAIVIIVLLVVALWFVVEVAIPVVLFILYAVPRLMVAMVINDRHRCRGRLGRSILWGFLWATGYTAPLALLVWFVHHVLAKGR
jgi:hypothetical protein